MGGIVKKLRKCLSRKLRKEISDAEKVHKKTIDRSAVTSEFQRN